MHFRQRKVLGALERILVFLDTHNDRLGTVNTGGARSILNEVVQKVNDLIDQQDTTRVARKSSIEADHAAQDSLRDKHMRPIARIARLELRSTLEFPQLRLPHRSVDSQTLVVWARNMAQGAAPHVATFVKNGMTPDFGTKLLDAAEAVQKAWTAQQRARARSQGATEGLRKEVSRAAGVIGVIDAMVTAAIGDVPELVREWEATSRVVKKAVRASQTPDTPAVPATSPPAGPTTAPAPSSPPAASADVVKPASPKEAA